LSDLASKKIGKQTVRFEKRVFIAAGAAVVGRKEGEGPLGHEFDAVKEDSLMGEDSFERAEATMLEDACRLALLSARAAPESIDAFYAGDLLNQTISANYCARELSIPFFGLYGACSTFSEALILASTLIDGGFGRSALVAVSSHHDTAERQYRYPTEFGGQRPPFAQWTVTGAGACVLDSSSGGPVITQATIGRVYDMGVKDANNMGAAMAPAACETVRAHFEDSGRPLDYYDMVLTGDLGRVGRDILADLLEARGIRLGERLADCGVLMYGPGQDVHAGGSGCGCSASVFLGHVYKQLKSRRLLRVLLVATGALHSPCMVQQGESIPGIAHAVAVEMHMGGRLEAR